MFERRAKPGQAHFATASFHVRAGVGLSQQVGFRTNLMWFNLANKVVCDDPLNTLNGNPDNVLIEISLTLAFDFIQIRLKVLEWCGSVCDDQHVVIAYRLVIVVNPYPCVDRWKVRAYRNTSTYLDETSNDFVNQ